MVFLYSSVPENLDVVHVHSNAFIRCQVDLPHGTNNITAESKRNRLWNPFMVEWLVSNGGGHWEDFGLQPV